MSNQYKTAQAIDLFEKYTEEGDVINTIGHPKWYQFILKIGYWGIRKAHKELFGKDFIPYGSIPIKIKPYMQTHSMIKFSNSSVRKYIINELKVRKILEKDRWAKVFSVETPIATLKDSKSFIFEDICVYRYTKKRLDENDIKILLKATVPLLGTKYDYGQLLNIATNQMLGYSFDEKTKVFDMGGKRKVCSVGVAAVFQIWRKELEKQGIKIPRLFSKLNRNNWDPKFLKKFDEVGRWNVENTYPAMYALTKKYYNSEFELVLRMRNGKILYRKSMEN